MELGEFQDAKNDFDQVLFYSFSVILYENHNGSITGSLLLNVLSFQWRQMMKFDKSSEPDAKAALQKLKQREQVCYSCRY